MSYIPVCLNCHKGLILENTDGEEIYIGGVFCSLHCASNWAIDVTESYYWDGVRGRWNAEGVSCDTVVCGICKGGVKYDSKSKWYCMSCKDTVEVIPNKV